MIVVYTARLALCVVYLFFSFSVYKARVRVVLKRGVETF